jgi:hypothetical protein
MQHHEIDAASNMVLTPKIQTFFPTKTNIPPNTLLLALDPHLTSRLDNTNDPA